VENFNQVHLDVHGTQKIYTNHSHPAIKNVVDVLNCNS